MSFFFCLPGLAYDALLLWAHGVNKTIEQGYAPNDGMRVTNNIINSTVRGVTGNIVIDENGDRLRDFKVGDISFFNILVLWPIQEDRLSK